MAMSNRSLLSVVPPGAKAPRKTPATITESLSGTSRDVLASMRHALAKKLDAGEVSSNAIASAYKELRELDRLIRAMDAAEDEGASSGRGVVPQAFDASAI